MECDMNIHEFVQGDLFYGVPTCRTCGRMLMQGNHPEAFSLHKELEGNMEFEVAPIPEPGFMQLPSPYSHDPGDSADLYDLDATCMTCGEQIRITDTENMYGGPVFQFEHPGRGAGVENYMLSLSKEIGMKKVRAEIGRWIRTRVHPDKYAQYIGATHERTDYPGAIPWNEPQQEPVFTEKNLDHVRKILQEIIGPALGTIGAAFHLTESLGAMEQITFSVEDDCGFQAEMVFRVRTVGTCFRRSDIPKQQDHSHDSDVPVEHGGHEELAADAPIP